MNELKPHMVCDLCRFGRADETCYNGGVNKCLKNGRYTRFESKNCPSMEHVEGGIPYCADKQTACDNCETNVADFLNDYMV